MVSCRPKLLRSLGSWIAVGGLTLTAAHVQAHDPPEVTRIAWLPGAANADRALFQTARGFIVGESSASGGPGARSYRWACIEGLGLDLGEQPSLVVLPDSSWLVATEHGVKSSSDEGCSWSPVSQLGESSASALVSVPGDAKHLLLALAGAADGGLYESRDAGASWQKRLHLAPDDYVAQIGVAASDSARIYLSGLVIDEDADKFSFQLTRSRDGGLSWDRAYIPLGPDEDRAVLAAISPKDPNTLVVLANNHRWGEVPDRALFSNDAGATYRELARGVKLTSATFDAEGKQVILAGGDSLARVDPSASGEQALQKIGESQLLSCAQSGPQGLYACGHVNKFDPVNAGAFVSNDDGASWQSLMAFTEVKQAVQCTDQAAAQQCKDQWLDWQLEILVGLGGASIDTVEGWQDFKGIEEAPPSAPAHTLATAQRSQPGSAASSGGRMPGADEMPAATSSKAAGTKPEPDATADPAKTAQMTSAGGCQTALSPRSRGPAALLLCLCLVSLRRRARPLVTSLRAFSDR